MISLIAMTWFTCWSEKSGSQRIPGFRGIRSLVNFNFGNKDFDRFRVILFTKEYRDRVPQSRTTVIKLNVSTFEG